MESEFSLMEVTTDETLSYILSPPEAESLSETFQSSEEPSDPALPADETTSFHEELPSAPPASVSFTPDTMELPTSIAEEATEADYTSTEDTTADSGLPTASDY